MVYMLLLPFISLITLTGARSKHVTCDTVPEDGDVTIDIEGIYTFTCKSSHELVGERTARCIHDKLNIKKLPLCVLRRPITTHTRSRYYGVACSDPEIEERVAFLDNFLSALECLESAACTVQFKHTCPQLNEIEIEAIFTVSNKQTSASIKNFVAQLNQDSGALGLLGNLDSGTSHRRSKRDIDSLTPNTTDINDCSDGEGLSSDGESCVECQAGFYGLNDACTECAIGSYQNDTGQTSCTDCAGDMSTTATASDDEADCLYLCTLPTESYSSLFTIDNVEKEDGSNLDPGTAVTLLCDTGYTYKGESSQVLDCTDNTTDVQNECYRVVISPTTAVYKFSDDSEEITCSVNANVTLTDYSVTLKNGDSEATNVTAGTATYLNSTVAQSFTVDADSGDGEYSCDIAINGNSEPESSATTIDVAFVTFSMTAEATANAGDSFTITAKLTYNADLASTEFSWSLDGVDLLTNIDTSWDDDYFYSEIQISDVSLDDAGLYVANVSVKDLTGTEQLSSTRNMLFSVKGFTIHPADASGGSLTTRQKDEELILTCAVSGSSDAAEDIQWYKDSAQVEFADDSTDGSIVNTLSGSITTSLLTVNEISSTYAGVYGCQLASLESENVTVVMTDYSVVMGDSARCAESGTDKAITCTASYPTSLSTAPTISWYQVGSPNDTVLADGDYYVMSATQVGTSYVSELTLKDVAAGDTYDGSYYCQAIYTDPSYIEVTAETQTTFTVVGLNEMATQYALVGDTDVTFSTTFYGEQPIDAEWQRESTIFSNNSVTTNGVEISSSGASFWLSVATVSTDVFASYDAYVLLDACEDDVGESLVTTATLEILSVNISSSDDYVFEGDDIVIECEFSNPSSFDSSPSVTWTVGGAAYNGTPDSSATNSNPIGSQSLTVSSATVADASSYACTVEYSQGNVTKSADVTVLGGYGMDNLYLVAAADATFTCTFFGSDGSIEWTKSGDESLDLSSMITTDDYTDGEIESRLAFTNVTTDDEGEYNCEITFTGISETKKTTARLYIMNVEVSGDDVISLGDSATLTCDEGTQPGTFSWSKGSETLSGETDASLTLETATFDTAGDYVCTVVYDDNVGTVASDPHTLFVEDFVSLEQINMAGDYNDVGETITLSAVIKGSGEPSVFEVYEGATQLTVTNVPSATDGGDDEYTVEVEYTAISNTDAENDATIRLVCTNLGDIEKTLDLKIYEPCTLPNITNIDLLSGGSLDHMATLDDLACTDSYILGGTSVSCDDGALTYSPDTDVSSCTDLSIDLNPISQLVELGDIVTLTCATDELDLDIAQVVWSDASEDVYTDEDPVASGSTVYTSTYPITGTEALNGKEYKCTVHTSSGDTAVSSAALIYIVGVKSGEASYPGNYFESDKQAGDLSESGTITFEIFEGPGSPTVTVSLTLASDGAVIPNVAFNASAVVDDVLTYTYDVIETYKETGTYTVNVTYDSELAGTKTFEMELLVAVHEFCEIADLAAVPDGSWSPDTKVDYMSYATLTCVEGTYIQGDSTTRCEAGTETSQFDVVTYPTCEEETELSCGSLEDTDNGAAQYISSTAAYYSCDSGYALIGDQETYTCNTGTGDWSIITSDNPYGDAPVCQEINEALERYAHVTLIIGTSGASCQNQEEVDSVETALQIALEESDLLDCTEDYLCNLQDFTCVYESADSGVVVNFNLTQTGELTDSSVLSDDVANFVDNIDQVSFEVVHSKKKRATVEFNGLSASGTITTMCDADFVTDGDDCIQCPAGYGYDTSECAACSLGYYSDSNSIVACSACSGSLTTQLIGTTSATDCVEADDVCTVTAPEATATLSPPGGSRVEADSTITITCNSGYGLEINSSYTFRCDTDPYPTCYLTCSLAEYTDDELADRFIHDNIEAAYLSHNEALKVTCQSGYQFEEDMPVKTFTCDNGVLADFGSCVETSGSAVLTTVIVCVVVLAVAIIFLFLFILVQWRKKKNDAYNKKQERMGELVDLDAQPGPSDIDGHIYINKEGQREKKGKKRERIDAQPGRSDTDGNIYINTEGQQEIPLENVDLAGPSNKEDGNIYTNKDGQRI